MPQRITLITVGVRDVSRAESFDTTLGWEVAAGPTFIRPDRGGLRQ